MTDSQKDKIKELRTSGYSYAAIALEIGSNKDAVRSYCRNYNIDSACAYGKSIAAKSVCKVCGKPLVHAAGKRRKEFCSSKCRSAYWRRTKNSSKVFTCACCGKTFYGFTSKNPKYCSRVCYLKARYGEA